MNGNNIYIAEGIYTYRGDETPVSPTDTFLMPAYTSEEVIEPLFFKAKPPSAILSIRNQIAHFPLRP